MVRSQPIEGVIVWMRSLYEHVDGWMSSNAVGETVRRVVAIVPGRREVKGASGPGLHP
jgi:hypothetical protein